MSFLKTREKRTGAVIPFVNLRIAEGKDSSDKAYDDKFTDDGGNTSFVMHKPGPHTVYANYRSVDMERFILEKYGHFNQGPKYNQVSVYVEDLEAGEVLLELTRQDAPSPIPPTNGCPINFNKQQFHDWFFSLVQKYNAPLVTIGAMEMMVPDLQRCGMLWQNQGIYPSNQWRPRIHQPPIRPDHDSDHNVDCGDFDKPWELTFRY